MKNLKIVWVGPKESDIQNIKDRFYKTITYYGSNESNNISLNECEGVRIRNMHTNTFAFEFYLKEIKKFISNDTKFMFYNPLVAYKISRHIPNFIQNCICINDYEILSFLNDKAKTRLWLREYVNVPIFKMLSGEHCKNEPLQKIFNSKEKFIVQENISSGGNGTYIVDSESKFVPNSNKIYLCSEYIENNISLNVHVIVSSNNLSIEEPSIQLIDKKDGKLIYLGADYIEAKNLTCIDELKRQANIIATLLQEIGYRGICGIDFIYSNNSLYFIELNPRFQASTFLLNDFRLSSGLKTMQELQIDAFNNELELQENYNPNESFYRIIHSETDEFEKYLYASANTSPYFNYINDDSAFDSKKIQEGAYLYNLVFNTNVCSINADGSIFIAENIKNHNLDNFFDFKNDLLKLKIALVNQGVVLPKSFVDYCVTIGGLKEGVFSAIDIILNGELYVNTPCNIKFTELSPFKIDIDEDKNPSLYYLDKKLMNIEIYTKQELKVSRTRNNIHFDRIAFLATDRVRIRHYHSCYYKDKNIGCLFCNSKKQANEFSYEDIVDAIDYYLENVDFRHFLIGGGTGLPNKETKMISKIASYISSKSSKPIYVMSIPPVNIEDLKSYYDSGVTEVAFNIEIFDRIKAASIMPGKGHIPFENYLTALQNATSIFGNTGNVRSMLIYGFDDTKTFYEGIETLARIGVAPIISIFRPMPNTVFEDYIAPDNAKLYEIFKKSNAICNKYNLELGPTCVACQNNTLSFSSNINRYCEFLD